MPSGGRRRGAALGLAAALASATFLGVWSGGPSAAAQPAASARIVLLGQTQWVIPASPGATSPFVLDVAARTAPAGAQVSAGVYPRLHARDDFEAWVRSGPHGSPTARTGPAPLATLPRAPRTAGGSDLTLEIATHATPGTPGPVVDLGCAPPTGAGTCTGVYPVEVELTDPSGTVLARLTTFLTYQISKSVHPLELALVLKLASPVALAPTPSHHDTVRPLDAKGAAGLVGTVAALHANPEVPVTLDTSPETLLALDASGTAGRATVSDLAAMSADRPGTEVLQSPYVPVNVGALSAAGQGAAISAQMSAGATALRRLHVLTASGPGTWLVTGPAGRDLPGGLARVGAGQVVVPGSDLAPTTFASETASTRYGGTWTSTFDLLPGRSTATAVHAALTDTFLSEQLTRAGADPALAAAQVLADLAMVHFERPNTTAVRGLVAVGPDAALADPAFYRDLLAGLAHDPDVAPVTLSQFFATVTLKGTRALNRTATGPTLDRRLVGAMSSARAALHEFDASVDGRPAILSRLQDDLLAAESADLPASRQESGIATFRHVLSDQLHLVSLGTGSAYTLTARTGWIPVTVDSRAPYTLVGTLTVNGSKFIFPHANSHAMRLDHATNLWRVEVKVRTSGDLPLHAVFTSPDGRLVIARGHLTVRSTATSVVGIALSGIALAILLTWWGRTWWAGRSRRKRLRRAPSAT